jgi:hypothetical protein
MALIAVLAIGCKLESGAVDLDPDAGDNGADASSDAPVEELDPYAGQQFFEVEVASFSTDSATYVPVTGAALELPARPGSMWLLALSASLRSGLAINDPLSARLLVDGVERGIGAGHMDGGGLPMPWLGIDAADANAARSVAVELRTNGAMDAEILDLRLVAVALPAAAVAVADAPAAVEVSTRAELATLDVGVLGAPEVLVFGAVNASEAPSTTSVSAHLLAPGETDWPALVASNNRGNLMPIVFVRRFAPNAAATVRLQAESNNIGTAQHARIIAIDAAAFETVETASSAEPTAIAGGDAAQTLAIEPAAAPAVRRDYLRVHTASYNDNSDLESTYSVEFLRGGAAELSQSRLCLASCPAATYGLLDAYTLDPGDSLGPLSIRTGSSATGAGVTAFAETIAIFRLRP